MSSWIQNTRAFGPGHFAPMGSLEDPALLGRIRRYRQDVAKRYRAIDATRLAALIPKGKLWLSPKLDGELWFLVKQQGEIALVAHNGRILTGVPALATYASALAGVQEILVAGELVGRAADGRPRVGHVAAALADAQRADELSFFPFDLVDEDGRETHTRPFAERIARLQALFGTDGPGAPVTTVEAEASALESTYREWVTAGRAEGVVARSEQGITFKLKPFVTLDVVVVAFGERVTAGVPELRELSVALLRDEGTLQLIGAVGGGFSAEDRVQWHRQLTPSIVPSTFRMANGDGTLSRFVRPETVIEVRCSDLITLDTSDAPVRRMALRYDPAAGYTPAGEAVTAVMLHPVFVRARGDKSVNPTDVGLDQLTRYVALEVDTGEPSRPAVAARVVARGVWTKETKGKLAVRKYVILDHGDASRREYPPFTVFFTDFSAGRAEPLETTVRSASTRELADAQVEAWKTENVKRGWNPA